MRILTSPSLSPTVVVSCGLQRILNLPAQSKACFHSTYLGSHSCQPLLHLPVWQRVLQSGLGQETLFSIPAKPGIQPSHNKLSSFHSSQFLSPLPPDIHQWWFLLAVPPQDVQLLQRGRSRTWSVFPPPPAAPVVHLVAGDKRRKWAYYAVLRATCHTCTLWSGLLAQQCRQLCLTGQWQVFSPGLQWTLKEKGMIYWHSCTTCPHNPTND